MNNLANLEYLTSSMKPFTIMVLTFCIGTYVIAIGCMLFYVHRKESNKEDTATETDEANDERTDRKSSKRWFSSKSTKDFILHLIDTIARRNDAGNADKSVQSESSTSTGSRSTREESPDSISLRSRNTRQSVASARNSGSNVEPREEIHSSQQSHKSSDFTAEKDAGAKPARATSSVSQRNNSRTSLSGLSRVLSQRSGKGERDADENV